MKEKGDLTEMDTQNILRFAILKLEALKRELTANEKTEAEEIQRSLGLTEEEILARAKSELLS